MKKKDSKFTTRSHLEERHWLTHLGRGDLIEGVRILIERVKGDQTGGKIGKKKK
jgi:hypothetical protein